MREDVWSMAGSIEGFVATAWVSWRIGEICVEAGQLAAPGYREAMVARPTRLVSDRFKTWSDRVSWRPPKWMLMVCGDPCPADRPKSIGLAGGRGQCLRDWST